MPDSQRYPGNLYLINICWRYCRFLFLGLKRFIPKILRYFPLVEMRKSLLWRIIFFQNYKHRILIHTVVNNSIFAWRVTWNTLTVPLNQQTCHFHKINKNDFFQIQKRNVFFVSKGHIQYLSQETGFLERKIKDDNSWHKSCVVENIFLYLVFSL